jgi:hypothetical protein
MAKPKEIKRIASWAMLADIVDTAEDMEDEMEHKFCMKNSTAAALN